MKKAVLLFLMIILSLPLFAQAPLVPENYKPKTTEDFKKYESNVVNCINWLEESSVSENKNQNQEINAFILIWMIDCPYITITLDEKTAPFKMGKNSDLLMIFMGGWVKYAIETKDYDNQEKGIMAGIEASLAFYQKNKKDMKKDKVTEKFIKMQEKGELEEYVKQNKPKK